MNTQQSFEQQLQRAVAVVVDPIQSVRGKVVIDAFRLINPQMLMRGMEPRQTTSNIVFVVFSVVSSLYFFNLKHSFPFVLYSSNVTDSSSLFSIFS